MHVDPFSRIQLSALPTTTIRTSALLSLLTPPQCSYPILTTLPSTLPHLFIPLNDDTTSCLLSTLPLTLPFLHTHSTILLHCHAGISRSAATLIAYLLWTGYSTNVTSAFTQVRSKYPQIHPSHNFMHQLEAFAERACATAPRRYQFPPGEDIFIGPVEQTELVRLVTKERMIPNPNATNVLSCRACAMPLVPRNAVVRQDVNEWFVLPVRWMGENGIKEGRLRCPCGCKLGVVSMGEMRMQVVLSKVKVDCRWAAEKVGALIRDGGKRA